MKNRQSESPSSDDGYTHPDPVLDAALDWFTRLHAADFDPGLHARFEAWRDEDHRHAEAFARVQATWSMTEMRDAALNVSAREQRSTTRRSAAPDRSSLLRFRMGKVQRMAAAAVVVLAIFGVYQLPSLMLYWNADYITGTGERQEVRLPDGSIAVLDAESAISLDFSDGSRQVKLLDGRVYFDVVHDSVQPFHVTGQFGDVTVLGTAFEVQTDESQDQVVLQRGKVEVRLLGDPQIRALLDPSQQVRATSASLSEITAADLAQSLAWLEGRIVFYEKPLSEVLASLRRYHAGRVMITDSRVARVNVSGNFRLDDTEGAIRSLAKAAGAGIVQLPGQILILH